MKHGIAFNRCHGDEYEISYLMKRRKLHILPDMQHKHVAGKCICDVP